MGLLLLLALFVIVVCRVITGKHLSILLLLILLRIKCE